MLLFYNNTLRKESFVSKFTRRNENNQIIKIIIVEVMKWKRVFGKNVFAPDASRMIGECWTSGKIISPAIVGWEYTANHLK